MSENKDKILLILTGGTICSFPDENGEKSPHTEKAERLIRTIFKNSGSKYSQVEFDDKVPLNILSENITLDSWNKLVSAIRGYNIDDYRGVIILHGTDTLAYTSSMLSLLLAGSSVPVFLVSSQLPLTEDGANGNDNFKVAVHLIMEGIKPNVYVPYRNMDGKMYVHLGAHLCQCPVLSNDFKSMDPYYIEDVDNPQMAGIPFESNEDIIKKIGMFTPSVLMISPYVGLDYSRVKMSGIKAVVHGTYHSQTLCVEKTRRNDNISCYSVLKLKKCFKKTGKKVPLFLQPSNYVLSGNVSCYETTAEVVRQGAVAVWGMTEEMVYVKTIVGVALGYRASALENFVCNKRINHEFHY